MRSSRTSAAPNTGRSPTPRRWTRSGCCAALEGIIPAIESAHAVAGALKLGGELGPGAIIVVNLSGRGDKDVETAAKWFGLMDSPAREAMTVQHSEPSRLGPRVRMRAARRIARR